MKSLSQLANRSLTNGFSVQVAAVPDGNSATYRVYLHHLSDDAYHTWLIDENKPGWVTRDLLDYIARRGMVAVLVICELPLRAMGEELGRPYKNKTCVGLREVLDDQLPGAWVGAQVSSFRQCSCCGKLTNIRNEERRAAWYLCHKCEGTVEARAKGFTHH